MAIKDWKKFNDYTWSRKNDKIELITNMTSRDNVTYDVEIFIWETKDSDAKFVTRSFKSKSGAMAFIDNFMRSH